MARRKTPTATASAHRDALEWLPAHTTAPTLIYCDPPYLIRSRAQRAAATRFEMSLEDQSACSNPLQLPCMVQISAYADRSTARTSATAHMTFRTHPTRVATEHLWMSYPEPKALHTYTHLGADYREREAHQAQSERWTARLAACRGWNGSRSTAACPRRSTSRDTGPAGIAMLASVGRTSKTGEPY